MKQVAFSVNISQGYADWVIHQQYFNNLDQSREIVFLMPLNLGLELTQIEVDFVMMDGTIRTVVTKVIERGKEEQIYEDKVASTKTALAETLPKQCPSLNQTASHGIELPHLINKTLDTKIGVTLHGMIMPPRL